MKCKWPVQFYCQERLHRRLSSKLYILSEDYSSLCQTSSQLFLIFIEVISLRWKTIEMYSLLAVFQWWKLNLISKHIFVTLFLYILDLVSSYLIVVIVFQLSYLAVFNFKRIMKICLALIKYKNISICLTKSKFLVNSSQQKFLKT